MWALKARKLKANGCGLRKRVEQVVNVELFLQSQLHSAKYKIRGQLQDGGWNDGDVDSRKGRS